MTYQHRASALNNKIDFFISSSYCKARIKRVFAFLLFVHSRDPLDHVLHLAQCHYALRLSFRIEYDAYDL